MNKKILYTCMLGLGTLAVTSCSDPMDEITSIVYDRVFSPLNFQAIGATESTVDLRWVASEGAASYTIEIYQDDSLTFAGTPVQTITGVTERYYNVTGLVYDTKYSARIMALDSTNTSRNSKWTEVYFKSDAQQIFENVPNENIVDRSVTLTWPAGEAVTKITTVYTDDNGTASVIATKNLTADEIAAGKATIDGLTPSTKYTFYLYNGEKQRGSKAVTTIADLEGATIAYAGDDLKTIIANAAEGAVIALMPGEFTIPGEESGAGCAVLTKSLVIKGVYPTDVPTVYGRFELQEGASLEIDNIILDASQNEDGSQAFNFTTDGATYGKLVVSNTEIMNNAKGVFYLNVAATVNEITFRNCLIHDIVCDGGDLFDCRKGRIDALTIQNSTIWNCAAERDFIRMDDASALGGTPTITIDHCTIDNIITASTSRRLLYVRYVGNVINFTNNIVTNTTGIWSNQSKTSEPTFRNNVYYNTPNLNVVVEKANLFEDTNRTDADPAYKDAANGDFTVTNESLESVGAGDPRWN